MMRPARGVLFAVVLGCGPGPADASSSETGGGTGSGSTSTTSASASTDATTTTVGSTTVGTASTAGDDTTTACVPDEQEAGDEVHLDIGVDLECSSFDQDCPRGEKCVPDGFATRHCVPLAADPIPDGEPCTAGPDDPCGPTSWCGLASAGEGTCVALCAGNPDAPICPGDTICVIDDEGIAAFCQRPCDPFVPDSCPADACQGTPHGFGCVPDGYADVGEACFENDSCIDGMVCRRRDLVATCCHARCCTPLCSAEHPCEVGTCLFDPPVPGSETVGYCG